MVEKPLEHEKFLGALIPSCEEEHGNQEYEYIDTFFWI